MILQRRLLTCGYIMMWTFIEIQRMHVQYIKIQRSCFYCKSYIITYNYNRSHHDYSLTTSVDNSAYVESLMASAWSALSSRPCYKYISNHTDSIQDSNKQGHVYVISI